MDAYILGSHAGDLPTHLLSGPGGNRIRSMARLDGPDHDVFLALEVDEPDSVTVLTESLTDLGLIVSKTHMAATDQNKVGRFVVPHVLPSHMPPWEFYLFIHAEGVAEVPAELGTVSDDLGEGTVAVALGTDGNLLIELGSNDETAVAAGGALLTKALGGNVTTHTVVGGIITE